MVNRDRPDHVADLLRLDDVEAFVLGSHTRSSHLSLIRGGDPVPRDDYVFPSGIVDAVAVARAFDEGAAIVLPRANESFGPLAHLVRGLEAELGCRAQTNAYLSPTGASAFLPHHDAHDVIAVQAHGAKSWKIFESPWPVRPTVDFDARRDKPGDEILSFTTQQGDCCYLPQGVMHDAVSDGVSLHITVGIHWLRTSEVLPALVKRAVESQPDLHRVVPPAWWLEDEQAAVAQVRAGLDAIDDEAIRACLRYLREDLVATRQPIIPGQLRQLAALAEIGADTPIALRDLMLWDYEVDDEGPRLSVYGNDIRLPAAAAPVVEAILAAGRAGTTPATVAGSVPVADALVVVRRLVREGVVEVTTPGAEERLRA